MLQQTNQVAVATSDVNYGSAAVEGDDVAQRFAQTHHDIRRKDLAGEIEMRIGRPPLPLLTYARHGFPSSTFLCQRQSAFVATCLEARVEAQAATSSPQK